MRAIFYAVASLVLASPIAAHAIPVKYDVTYTATTGPSGTGSFFFDNAVGAITGFTWDFAGTTGGLVDGTFGTQSFVGDTLGRFVFEILSQTDVHPVSNCVGVTCSSATPITIGTGPLGATRFAFNSQSMLGDPVQYSFTDDSFNLLATGMITIAQSQSVPEPATLALLGIGLAGLSLSRRKPS